VEKGALFGDCVKTRILPKKKKRYDRPDGRLHAPIDDLSIEEVFPPRKHKTGINFDDYDKMCLHLSGANNS